MRTRQILDLHSYGKKAEKKAECRSCAGSFTLIQESREVLLNKRVDRRGVACHSKAVLMFLLCGTDSAHSCNSVCLRAESGLAPSASVIQANVEPVGPILLFLSVPLPVFFHSL